jgi:hypothetical protein
MHGISVYAFGASERTDSLCVGSLQVPKRSDSSTLTPNCACKAPAVCTPGSGHTIKACSSTSPPSHAAALVFHSLCDESVSQMSRD